MDNMENIIVPPALLQFVEAHMASFQCGAHHMDHVLRVCCLAQRLAKAEGGNQKIAYIAALCHDILDSKLLPQDAMESTETVLINALGANQEFLTEEQTKQVLYIVKNIGYRHLLDPTWFNNIHRECVELRCVQDADSLDAIGCTGIARCYAFGGKRNRPLFDLAEVIGSNPLSQSSYAAAKGSGVEHFFEKLLRVEGMMVTASGRLLAKKRQMRMLQWLEWLDEELCQGSIQGGDSEEKSLLSRNISAFREAVHDNVGLLRETDS